MTDDRTDVDRPALGVGMVGYAFMGAAHSQAWRTAGRFFDLPCAPAMTALAGRDAAGGRRPRPTAGLGVGRDRLASAARPRRRRTSSTSARRATPTPRSRSRRSRPASTCCARSRWPTPSRRPRRWSAPPSARGGPRRAVDGRLQLPAGARRSRWPASSSPRAGSAPSGTCGRQYLQDWIVDPEFPLVWRLRRSGPGPARSATSARTSSTSRSTSPGEPITGVSPG